MWDHWRSEERRVEKKIEICAHGCLDYVWCRHNCRIGTLSIKTSLFVRKRESLKILLIVCICSARFGDRTTSLEFLRWNCIYHKQLAKQNILLFVIQLHVHCYILFSLSWSWNCFHNCLSTIIGRHGPKGFRVYRKLIKANYVIVWEGYSWVLDVKT